MFLDSIPQTEQRQTQSSSSYSMRAELIAEFIGTTILVQVGTGANCQALFLRNTDGMWQIAVVWILAATLAIYAVGKISGGHLNPAVTLSFALFRSGDFHLGKLVPYWLAQIAGGFLGAVINMSIFYKAVADYETEHRLERGTQKGIRSAAAFTDFWSLSDSVGGGVHAFFLEALGTAFLVFVVFAVTNNKNNVPSAAVPVLVGSAIGAMVFLIGPFTK
jgi:glycerol uptake facilitator protein